MRHNFSLTSIVEDCLKLKKLGCTVIVAGLNKDYLNEEFKSVYGLIDIADSTTKLYAICNKCKKPASRSHRLSNETSKIFLGHKDCYEPFVKNVMKMLNKFFSTRLELNYKQLVKNLNYLKSNLGDKTEIIAVLKANAYGFGDVVLAEKILNQGIKIIAVADFEEGARLRKIGIKNNNNNVSRSK